MAKPKTRTMYMHTLDGQPARFDARDGGFLYFCGGTATVVLVPTLRRLRREQQMAITAAASDPNQVCNGWHKPKRYSYVRVEVPSSAR